MNNIPYDRMIHDCLEAANMILRLQSEKNCDKQLFIARFAAGHVDVVFNSLCEHFSIDGVTQYKSDPI